MQSIYTWLSDQFEILCQQHSPNEYLPHITWHTGLQYQPAETPAQLLCSILPKNVLLHLFATPQRQRAHKQKRTVEIHPSFLLAVFPAHVPELSIFFLFDFSLNAKNKLYYVLCNLCFAFEIFGTAKKEIYIVSRHQAKFNNFKY